MTKRVDPPIYPDWVIPCAIARMNWIIHRSRYHSLQCDVCKGFHSVPKIVSRLYRCPECSALSYALQRKAGRSPDSWGHYYKTEFP